jgi:hydrogenase/urease accessory protein HupE
VRPTPPRSPRIPRLTDPRVPRVLRLLGLVLLAAAAPAAAHPVPFSYLDLRLDASGRAPAVSGTLTVHVFDAAHELSIDPPERLLDPAVAADRAAALEALFRPRLSLTDDYGVREIVWGPIEVLPDKQSLRLPFSVGSNQGQTRVRPSILGLKVALFPYDPKHQTFVNVYEDSALRQQIILDASRESFEYYSGSPRGTFAIVQRFVSAGIHHILIGPDHILFLVGLLLLGGSIRRLLLVVTAFTVAHSITLSIATLNIFSPPSGVVEPLIALSIVYVGCDNLLIRGGRDVRAWIALAFGFVHGFGFASVLREMDLPPRALGWSLFSFNLGVEIGQLMVVVLVASALAALRHRSEIAGRRLAFAGSLVVVIAGAFWFVERVFFPGGSV